MATFRLYEASTSGDALDLDLADYEIVSQTAQVVVLTSDVAGAPDTMRLVFETDGTLKSVVTLDGGEVLMRASAFDGAPGRAEIDAALAGGGTYDVIASVTSSTLNIFNAEPDVVTGLDIVSTAADDRLFGGTGDDTFHDVGGALDIYDGGDGFDTLSFATTGAAGGIDVNLAFDAIRDGEGGRDRVIDIELIVGTSDADRFRGDGGDNAFDGGAGNDVFFMGAGNDTLTGGAGRDTYVVDGAGGGRTTITDFDAADDRLAVDVLGTRLDLDLSTLTLTDGAGGALVQIDLDTEIELAGWTVADLTLEFGL